MQYARYPERKLPEPPGLAALSHLAWGAALPAILDATSGLENGRRLGSHSIAGRAAEGAACARLWWVGIAAAYAAGIRKIVIDLTHAWRSKRGPALR